MNSESVQERPPLASVLVLCWNSASYISRCLDCLTKQTFKDFEVIVIDNGSTDGSDALLKGDWKGLDLRIERLDMNKGFAVANNLGARLARGKSLALLNADAFPEPNWLEILLRSAEECPEFSTISSRQIQANAPELLDGAGDAYHITGLAWRRHYNKSVQDHGKHAEEVFSACPAAALYRREEFLNVGGFDEDYFSYFEDVDLGFRLRLAGKKCLYIPEAVVHHVGTASTGKRSDFSVYYGYRNLIWTFVKDMPSPLFWIFMPLHIAAMLFFVLYLTLRGQGKVVRKAIADAIRGLPKTIEKRKVIQKNIQIKPSDLLKIISTGLLEPYGEFFQRNKRK
jgi:GT2 family glycosyltransferase